MLSESLSEISFLLGPQQAQVLYGGIALKKLNLHIK